MPQTFLKTTFLIMSMSATKPSILTSSRKKEITAKSSKDIWPKSINWLSLQIYQQLPLKELQIQILQSQKLFQLTPTKKDYSLNDIKIKSTKARINPLRLLSKAKSHKTASPKIIPPLPSQFNIFLIRCINHF